MKAAIDTLKEHHEFLCEELKTERKRLGEVEKTRTYHVDTIARKERELTEVNTALVKLGAL